MAFARRINLRVVLAVTRVEDLVLQAGRQLTTSTPHTRYQTGAL